MHFYKKDNTITVESGEPFDPEKIVESGQVFRYNKAGEGYEIFSGDKKCLVYRNGKDAGIVVDAKRQEENAAYFIDYFNLKTPYAKINKELRQLTCPAKCGDVLGKAIKHGLGIRVLKQDKFETIISFIVSSNNNIARIKGIIEKLCRNLGKKSESFYAFPAPDVMAAQTEGFYAGIGCGYRAGWILDASRKIAEGFDIDSAAALPTGELLKRLAALKGVGPKVADCIALFGYNRYEVFPVDTWVKKAYRDLFAASPGNTVMRRNLTRVFGNYGGIAQQYLFYYYRNRGL
jgi:N-glycosylase/DNA lyase